MNAMVMLSVISLNYFMFQGGLTAAYIIKKNNNWVHNFEFTHKVKYIQTF